LSDRFNTEVHTNNRSNPKYLKIFDWIKAAKIIKENNIQNASLSLDVTFDNTILILQNGKPLEITDNKFLFTGLNPVLINNDSGEIIDCFFSINEQDVGYDTIYSSRSTDLIPSSGWPKVALDIIKGSFYYKYIGENKFSQVYLISPLFYFWRILECGGGCFGL
jgi:hypothetical protein